MKDYWKVGSVGQNEVLRTMSVLSEYPEEKVVIGIDGCGVPVFAYPMKNIATAYKNLACIDTIQDDVLQDAARRFIPRIHEYPHMMRGTGYLCSLINHDANIIAKGGANSVYGIGIKKERIGISSRLRTAPRQSGRSSSARSSARSATITPIPIRCSSRLTTASPSTTTTHPSAK